MRCRGLLSSRRQGGRSGGRNRSVCSPTPPGISGIATQLCQDTVVAGAFAVRGHLKVVCQSARNTRQQGAYGCVVRVGSDVAQPYVRGVLLARPWCIGRGSGWRRESKVARRPAPWGGRGGCGRNRSSSSRSSGRSACVKVGTHPLLVRRGQRRKRKRRVGRRLKVTAITGMVVRLFGVAGVKVRLAVVLGGRKGVRCASKGVGGHPSLLTGQSA